MKISHSEKIPTTTSRREKEGGEGSISLGRWLSLTPGGEKKKLQSEHATELVTRGQEKIVCLSFGREVRGRPK